MKEGWEKLKLGEFCTFQNGRAFKKNEWTNKGLPIIRIGNLNNSNTPFNFYAGDYEEKIVIEYGNLLFSWSGTVGSSFGAHVWKSEKGLLNQHIYKVGFENSIVNSDFLFYLLKYITKELEKLVSGAVGLVHVKKSTLVNYEVFIPPLDEQKRIVAKLDECFEAIDKARANVEKNLQNAKELFQSKLNEIFSQKGDGWVERKLDEVSNIIYGYTAKAKHEPATAKYLRITDIQNSNVNWESVPYCDLEQNEFDKYQLKIGDIVFARTGATTGKSFIIKNPPKAVFASYLIRVQIDNEELKPNFLYLFFQSSYYWYLINKGISGSAQGGFNASKLKKLSISFPVSLEKQMIIIKEMEELKSQTQSLESNYQQELNALDELKKSILQKAFNGEL